MKKVLIVSGSLFIIIILAAQSAGIILNITKSYPLGFYQKTNAPIAKGQMVIFCPTPSTAMQMALKRGYLRAGFCPSGSGVMIKKIFAVQGDHVQIARDGVFVNGQLLPNSKPMATDSALRALPSIKLNTILKNRELLLMSDYSRKSFDARYWGISDKSQIISAIQPLWIWSNIP